MYIQRAYFPSTQNTPFWGVFWVPKWTPRGTAPGAGAREGAPAGRPGVHFFGYLITLPFGTENPLFFSGPFFGPGRGTPVWDPILAHPWVRLGGGCPPNPPLCSELRSIQGNWSGALGYPLRATRALLYTIVHPRDVCATFVAMEARSDDHCDDALRIHRHAPRVSGRSERSEQCLPSNRCMPQAR